jgi:thiamine-monophosphate kinase
VGQSRQGCILTRSGANKSDLVVVSGCPGMAALARSQIESGEIPDPRAGEALHRPLPRVALGAALVGKATSCIDISDGLLADLGHIAADSGLGVRLETDRLPGHQVLDRVDVTTRRTMQLSGGDDYELCFTLPVRLESELTVLTRDLDIPLTVIGSMTGSPGVRCYDRHGVEYEESPKGFEHFS